VQDTNKVKQGDQAVHNWYRFVLSFPPHLVRSYIETWSLSRCDRVLDPFCGTGTTLVECKKLGLTSVGIDPNPVASFASTVKVSWEVIPEELLAHASRVRALALEMLRTQGLDDTGLPLFAAQSTDTDVALKTLPVESQRLLIKNSISPRPLHKALVLLEAMRRLSNPEYDSFELLALAKAVVSASNLSFGPEIGVRRPKKDAAVVEPWYDNVVTMARDLGMVTRDVVPPVAVVHKADSRCAGACLEPSSVSAVITSPPYPNEKDYTRTTRLELVLLGFVKTGHDLRDLKRSLICSNTRCTYKADEDHLLVKDNELVQEVAAEIEKRRLHLGKESGFERLYSRVTKEYFGGMARHLASLRPVLRPGARLAYVVGDQASYFRVMIRTGTLLADIAKSLGYELIGIDLFRTRRATVTKRQLREEVVVLRWPG